MTDESMAQTYERSEEGTPPTRRVVKVTRHVTVTTYNDVSTYRDWTGRSKRESGKRDLGRQFSDDEIRAAEIDQDPSDAFQATIEAVEVANSEDIVQTCEVEIIDVVAE